MSSKGLKGRVALVTGGSRGIGRATVLRLAEEGAAVAVNYYQQAEAAGEVIEQIHKKRGRAIAVQADIANAKAVNAMVEESERELGPIDILVNNAGVLHQGDLLSSWDEDHLDEMWRVNVKGLLYCTRAVARGMVQRKWGRIVNLSSIAALGTSLAGTTLYAATKGAVLILTKRMALELGAEGIRVNAVCPGYVVTDIVTAGRSREQVKKSIESVASKSMLKRVGNPEDIAGVIAFLAGDEANFLTGQVVTVDGGRMDFLAP